SARRAALLRRLYPYLPDLHKQPAEYLQSFFHITADDLASPWFSHLPRWRLTSRLKLLFSAEMRAALAGYDGLANMAAGTPSRRHSTWSPRTCCPDICCRRRATAWRWRTASNAAIHFSIHGS